MIALAGYQFAEFRRTRYWVGVLAGYLIFLPLFWVRIAHDHPGSYGNAAIGLLATSFGLSWVLAASQDRARWQILVVAAGSRERALASRVLLGYLLSIPLAVLAMVVAASHKLATDRPPALVAALMLYLLVSLIGCLFGTEAGRRAALRSIAPVSVAVCVVLLLAV